MKHLKFTYVDAITGVSIAITPAMNGTKFPEVAGLEFVWARESAYPTPVPEFFGTCPDASDINKPGVMGVFLQTDWEQMRLDEMAARPQPPDIQTVVVQSTQARLDAFFQTRGYDSILSACTYSSSGVPKFATEGQYAIAIRDSTWATLYGFMAEVQAGTTPMPTGFADVEPLLPPLAWPTE